MELESLGYFKELTRDLNMTQTAKRLFLSQQTLSNHIARLEKWCGTPLFYRKPRLSLTSAGLSLLDFTNRVLNEEEDFRGVLSDIRDESRGLIRFGASFVRYNATLPAILPQFTQKYPQVSFHLTDDASAHLMQQLLAGELDVALTVQSENLPGLINEPMLSNQLYLCVSDRLLQQYYGNQAEMIKLRSRNGAHLSDFAKLPFLIITPPNHLGTILANCFEEAGYLPRIYLQMDHLRLSETLASKALCAAFTTTTPLNSSRNQMARDVNIFPLLYKEKPVFHRLYLAYYEKRYHPRYVLYFIQLIKNYFSQIEDTDLTYISESGGEE